ncbi:hypothetical protein C8Q76DRAFT_802723 [Earliella scabrosa]|nr:hypothetical protein C8Q76DRAFT_802723 [Earliella scabrosa]
MQSLTFHNQPAPTVPHPSSSATVEVYAHWRGYINDRDRRDTRTFTTDGHIYQVAIVPTAPLTVETCVRVLAMSPAAYSSSSADPDQCNAYDAHVVGKVTRVVGCRARRVVLEVVNECTVNPVRRVRLELPYVPDVTVHRRLVELEEGLEEAHEGDLDTFTKIMPPPMNGRCKARQCTLHLPAVYSFDYFVLQENQVDVDWRPRAARLI